MRLSIQRAAAAALVCLTLAGCGYTLVGQGSNIPDDVEQVFVEPLENQTPRAQVEQILTAAIVDELVTRRRFEVVNDRASADAILSGSVTEFLLRPLTFDAEGLANNLEVAITGDMIFARPAPPGEEQGEVLWSNSRYIFREDYPVDDPGLGFQERETEALEETSEAFAETLVTDLLEGF